MSNDDAKMMEPFGEAFEVSPLNAPLSGTVSVPGDKSISHRAVLFAAMADGVSHLEGVLASEDVKASIAAVKKLGAKVNLAEREDGSLAGTVEGWGSGGPIQPDSPIDCGNSGTTARLLMGLLAPWPITVEITGDESLMHRPMRRNTVPLMKMGVRFSPSEADHLPIVETGTSNLAAIEYDSPMASAQLKTAILLAGVYADGVTAVNEPAPSRNHTELMLPEFGVPTTAGTRMAAVSGPVQMSAKDINVPGDPSSAAFLCCAAILKEGSAIRVDNISLNPARIGFVRTLERMGANIAEHRTGSEGKEPCGYIDVSFTESLRGCEVPSQHFASIVDEIPVLSLVAAHAKGITVFKGISELRVKESNRLQAIIDGLAALGVDAWEESDNLFIEGNPSLEVPAGLTFESHGDHRLAMTWSLVGLCGSAPVNVVDFDCVAVSYPDFMSDIRGLAE